MKTKYDQLHYRENKSERLRNEWLRCQIGRITMEQRNPRFPAEPVFHLLGYGDTMFEAEEMVERKLGRVIGIETAKGRNGDTANGGTI